jgi:4,5-DOPA dioxygenase extradiol
MTDTEPSTGPAMPALYIGHGAPPLLDDPVWSAQLVAWAGDLPRPKAILIVSAHWESAPVMLSATAPGTPLVYDFGGFERRFYEMTYPTPDASALARRVAAMMPAREPVHQHPSRGLDHGAWVPLKLMYPAGDIPVLQMSLPTQDPYRLLELGRRLRPLREEGVLVIGSGFLTHGLPFLTEFRVDAPAPGWSREFDTWAAEALARGDVDELASYRSRAPGMPYAHPTVEHFTPLFVTLGAATDPESPSDQRIDGFWTGLAKRSLQVA